MTARMIALLLAAALSTLAGCASLDIGYPETIANPARLASIAPRRVVVWEHEEDVTHAERLPLQAFTGDGELARQELKEVLERAGQRLANEFLYAPNAGR